MVFDATFWVAVSFVIFVGILIYFKIPQNVNNLLSKMISDIKNEIDESEKLRTDSKKLLDDAQSKLNSVSVETKKILDQAKSEADRLVIDMNDKFHKSAEIKKNLSKMKISQMKETAIKEIKDNSRTSLLGIFVTLKLFVKTFFKNSLFISFFLTNILLRKVSSV